MIKAAGKGQDSSCPFSMEKYFLIPVEENLCICQTMIFQKKSLIYCMQKQSVNQILVKK